MNNWNKMFEDLQNKSYFINLNILIDEAYKQTTVYPDKSSIYRAFELTPLSSVKVVIIGQDPYHQPRQAHGLAFSVQEGVRLPPSLKNIYKEIEDDLHVTMDFNSGDLSYLAKQGVLLLNTILTVEQGKPKSHQHFGYHFLIYDIIDQLNQHTHPIVFLLWGDYSKKFSSNISNHHKILYAHHPSPLSANRGGWFGCKHFSKTNAFLISQQLEPIRWSNDFKISLL
jgi:uracil-DNA glycosylase